MAQFQVPQFIDTEDKLIGPLTLKQFGYVAAAGVLSFLLFFVLKTFIWVIFTIFMGAIAAAFAFIKYNGRPLGVIVAAAISYFWSPRFYVWKKSESSASIENLTAKELEAEQAMSQFQKEKPAAGASATPLPPAQKPEPRLKSLWVRLHTAAPSPTETKQQKVTIHEALKGKPTHAAFEVLRKMTGERQATKRVDYR